jgi:hypothetical protein
MPHHHHKHAFVTPTGADQTTTAVATIGDEQERSTPSSTAEAIRLFAYRKWESAGKPSGDGIEFWLEAEHELASAQ